MSTLTSAILSAAVLATAPQAALATLGFDTEYPITPSVAKCLKATYDFAAVRCGHSGGEFDTGSIDNIRNLKAAGFTDVSCYIWPCMKLPAATVAANIAAGLRANNLQPTTVYLDVETNTICPYPTEAQETTNSTDKAHGSGLDVTTSSLLRGAASNGGVTDSASTAGCSYLDALASAVKTQGYNVAMYSSAHEWQATVGSDCKACADLSLWYAHYETPPQANFNDFVPFGAFSHPSAKQYMGTHSVCGIDVDSSWYP